MKLNSFISLHPPDLDPLYSELTSIYDSFVATAMSPEEEASFAKLFKQEYPTLLKLKDLIEAVLIGENNTRNYERIQDTSETPKKECKTFKFKLVKKENPDGKI